MRWQMIIKRCFDIAGASAVLLFIAPLFVVLAACVATSGQPIFFAQDRVGRHGRSFRCLKFRTMVLNAEAKLSEILAADPAAAEEYRVNRKLRNDPRVTPVGAWLRKTSLDELPQLINVVRGEMSLVGPRPALPGELEEYGPLLTYYLQTRPGITGPWQVSGRNALGFSSRVDLDASYVQNWSLMRDFAILFMTVRVVFARQGAY